VWRPTTFREEVRGMQAQRVEQDIRKFLADRFHYLRGADVPADELLLGSVIDSSGLLELIMFLQEHFGIVVEDDDVVPENLGTVQHAIDYVERKLQAQVRAKTANG
jgi:acyl carrier protein